MASPKKDAMQEQTDDTLVYSVLKVLKATQELIEIV
jgi:hypothetical protein